MINRLICWLFGHRYKEHAVVCDIVDGQFIATEDSKPIGPCTRCGKEQQ